MALFQTLFILVLTAQCLSIPSFIQWSALEQAHSSAPRQDILTHMRSIWNHFKNTFKRNYIEDTKRFGIFLNNFRKAFQHNMAYKFGFSSFEMGINQFSDQTVEDTRSVRGYRYNARLAAKGNKKFMRSASPLPMPSSVDWRKHGYVTPIKNQGHCGSCWAFSATGAVEGQHFRSSKKLISLSEQQLVDCSSDYQNAGCNGGLMQNAFMYIKDNGGINSESVYPYVSGTTGHESDSCRFTRNNISATVAGIVNIRSGDEEELTEALANNGPISIAINAGLSSFMQYSRGIYDDPECDGEAQSLDHGVLLVGYGEERGIPYWIIKNSWGETWGEHGYIRIRRHNKNLCGVATDASYPIVNDSEQV